MTEVRFRDFSRKPRNISFDADGEHYDVRDAIAPSSLQEMLTALRSVKDDPVAALDTVMTIALQPDSAERIKPRLRAAHPNPLDIAQATDICVWLAEQLAARPTQPPTSSSDGSATAGDGTISADGAPPVA